MKQFNGFKSERMTGGYEPLPVGGYVCKIANAKIESYKTQDGTEIEKLVVAYDIAEGEHAGYYQEQYKQNPSADKKWRGTYRLTVPDESHKWYEGECRTFNNFIAAIEESNNGYHWNWDEKSLMNNFIGFVYGNFEYDVEGRQGWSTRAALVVSTDDIRKGNYKIPKDKALPKKEKEPEISYVSDKDLPF